MNAFILLASGEFNLNEASWFTSNEILLEEPFKVCRCESDFSVGL